jgi:prevent-host-death family protein
MKVKVVGAYETKAHFAKWLRLARAGHRVVITQRG